MKLSDWYNFNFGNEQFKCHLADVYVKIFRKESYERKDMILEHLMKPSDMISLFGDYNMFLLSQDVNYSTICVCIYKAN